MIEIVDTMSIETFEKIVQNWDISDEQVEIDFGRFVKGRIGRDSKTINDALWIVEFDRPQLIEKIAKKWSNSSPFFGEFARNWNKFEEVDWERPPRPLRRY